MDYTAEPEAMASDLLNAFVGLVVGLATGFYFERRATKSARLEAASLARELKVLRESVYTMRTPPPEVIGRRGPTSMPDERELEEWVRSHQNAAGSVSKERLFSHFLREGCSPGDVSHLLSKLAAEGIIRLNDKWIEIL